MSQCNYHGRWHFWNGLAFFICCTFVRVLGATVLFGFYIRDAVHFKPHAVLGAANAAGAWVAVLLSLVSYAVILFCSYYWYIKEVLSEVHKEFKLAFGAEYWKPWKRWLPKRTSQPKHVTSSRVEEKNNF